MWSNVQLSVLKLLPAFKWHPSAFTGVRNNQTCRRKKRRRKKSFCIWMKLHSLRFWFTTSFSNPQPHYMLRLLRAQPQQNQTFICVVAYSVKLDHVRFGWGLMSSFGSSFVLNSLYSSEKPMHGDRLWQDLSLLVTPLKGGLSLFCNMESNLICFVLGELCCCLARTCFLLAVV